MNYRTINKNEYSFLVDIHIKAFKDFFLTSLGRAFLTTYYKACLNNKESIGICAVDDKNQIVGFGVGCVLSKGYHTRLVKKNLFKFLIQGILILYLKPKALFRLAYNLDKNNVPNDDGYYAELLSIGVSPEIKSTGTGKEIIIKFEEEAIKKGCKKIALTTDLENNDHVISFYKKSGYKVYYEFTTYPNRRMYKFIKLLN